MADDYTVFVHVLAEEGAKVAQRDSPPLRWRVPDRHLAARRDRRGSLRVGPAAGRSARPLSLAVGLYLLETGERAAVVGRDDGTVYLDVP